MDERQQYDLGKLIMKSLDGTAVESEIEQLRQILTGDDSEALDYYMEYITLCAYLESPGNVSFQEPKDILDLQTWRLFAEHERTAPTVEAVETVKVKKTAEEPVKMLKVERPPRVINKFSLYTAVISIAALIFLLFYIRLVPVLPHAETATIVDSVDAVWGSHDGSAPKGGRLTTNSPFSLKKGFVKILFDNHAELIIEAPANFQILTDEQIQLGLGRLYAKISRDALGFSVVTPNSKVVDLGTEFAVQVDAFQNTELHVFKGKTNLHYGVGEFKEILLVSQGAAKRVPHSNNITVNIPCQKTRFVCQIDSANDLVWKNADRVDLAWKGVDRIDLADLVKGGNGLGTGKWGTCIDPATGNVGPLGSTTLGPFDRKEHSYLCEVRDLPSVDCVIIPGQNGGDLPLSTTGLHIPDFPRLLGSLYWAVQTQTYEKKYPLVLNKQTYGVGGKPAILIHANCGMTFDLNNIRQNMPVTNLISFEALCGINEPNLEGNFDAGRTAEVYIFLDGQQVFHEILHHVQNNAVPIKVDLQGKKPRFLTLLVCCGEVGNDFDWCVFGTPELILGNR